MRQLDSSLLKATYAQSGDTISLPTYDTDLDIETLLDGNDGGNGGNGNDNNDTTTQITLSSTSTSFEIDEQYTANIEIDSDGTELNSFTVRISYDPDFIGVIDSDTDLADIQIDTEETAFTITENTVNPAAGTITLRGEVNTPETLNEIVGSIVFQVLQEGETEIEIVVAESALVDDASTNILEITNDLTITTGTVQNDNQNEEGTIAEGDNPEVELNELPKSDLPYSGLIYMVLGVFLIVIGVKGRQIRNQEKQR